jgi:hypothetical protein
MARAAVSLLVEGLPDIDSDEMDMAGEEPGDNAESLQADGMDMGGTESKTAPEDAAHDAGSQSAYASTDTADRTDFADNKRGAAQSGRPPIPQAKPETRVYKGATYVKGADGQWHLQQK